MSQATPVAVVLRDDDRRHLELALIREDYAPDDCESCERIRKAIATAQTVAELSGERPL